MSESNVGIADIHAFLEKMEFNANSKMAEISHWGLSAIMESMASVSCKRIVRVMEKSNSDILSSDLLLAVLSKSSDWFEAEYGDEDGAGKRCYSSLAQEFIRLQSVSGILSNYKMEDWHTAQPPSPFSEAFIQYAISPKELTKVADLMLERDYAACFDLAQLIEDQSQRDDIKRFAARLKIYLSKRVGDLSSAELFLDQIAQTAEPGSDFDDFLDCLAAGTKSIDEDSSEEIPPYQLSKALFWEGTRRLSENDDRGTKMLRDSFHMDIDDFECILAGADLGIAWHKRILVEQVVSYAG